MFHDLDIIVFDVENGAFATKPGHPVTGLKLLAVVHGLL
jgi:hypothetical protein